MKIPVFVSCPTTMTADQEAFRAVLLEEFDRFDLEERRVGASDYPTELSLREVLVLARHCAGAVVLGFEQVYVEQGIVKRGTGRERRIDKPLALPTPWNHLEAGVLFSLDLPLLVFKEEGIEGGIFDGGVTEAFIHTLPSSDKLASQRKGLSKVFMKWQAKVRDRYYS